MSKNTKASNYLQKLYQEVWKEYSLEKFQEYYDKNLIAQTGQAQFGYDEFYEHVRLSHGRYTTQPQFHHIISTDDHRITGWFTQTVLNPDGSEAYRNNTMASYELKDGKIVRVDFMWEKPVDFVMENLVELEKPGLSIPSMPIQALLTRRELECFFHVIQAKTIKQIAQELNLSPRTVESYLENVKCKLTLNSIPQVVEYAVANGLLSISPVLATTLKNPNVKVPKPDLK